MSSKTTDVSGKQLVWMPMRERGEMNSVFLFWDEEASDVLVSQERDLGSDLRQQHFPSDFPRIQVSQLQLQAFFIDFFPHRFNLKPIFCITVALRGLLPPFSPTHREGQAQPLHTSLPCSHPAWLSFLCCSEPCCGRNKGQIGQTTAARLQSWPPSYRTTDIK